MFLVADYCGFSDSFWFPYSNLTTNCLMEQTLWDSSAMYIHWYVWVIHFRNYFPRTLAFDYTWCFLVFRPTVLIYSTNLFDSSEQSSSNLELRFDGSLRRSHAWKLSEHGIWSGQLWCWLLGKELHILSGCQYPQTGSCNYYGKHIHLAVLDFRLRLWMVSILR